MSHSPPNHPPDSRLAIHGGELHLWTSELVGNHSMRRDGMNQGQSTMRQSLNRSVNQHNNGNGDGAWNLKRSAGTQLVNTHTKRLLRRPSLNTSDCSSTINGSEDHITQYGITQYGWNTVWQVLKGIEADIAMYNLRQGLTSPIYSKLNSLHPHGDPENDKTYMVAHQRPRQVLQRMTPAYTPLGRTKEIIPLIKSSNCGILGVDWRYFPYSWFPGESNALPLHITTNTSGSYEHQSLPDKDEFAGSFFPCDTLMMAVLELARAMPDQIIYRSLSIAVDIDHSIVDEELFSFVANRAINSGRIQCQMLKAAINTVFSANKKRHEQSLDLLEPLMWKAIGLLDTMDDETCASRMDQTPTMSGALFRQGMAGKTLASTRVSHVEWPYTQAELIQAYSDQQPKDRSVNPYRSLLGDQRPVKTDTMMFPIEAYYDGTKHYDGRGYFMLGSVPCSVELSYQPFDEQLIEKLVRPAFSFNVPARLVPQLRHSLNIPAESNLQETLNLIEEGVIDTRARLYLILRPSFHIGTLSWIVPTQMTDVNRGPYQDGANCLIRLVSDASGWPHLIVTTLPGVRLEPGDTLRACWSYRGDWMQSYNQLLSQNGIAALQFVIDPFSSTTDRYSSSNGTVDTNRYLLEVKDTMNLKITCPEKCEELRTLKLCNSCSTPVLTQDGIVDVSVKNLLEALDHQFGLLGEACKLCGLCYHRCCYNGLNDSPARPCPECTARLQYSPSNSPRDVRRVMKSFCMEDNNSPDSWNDPLREKMQTNDLVACYRCVTDWISCLVQMNRTDKLKWSSESLLGIIPTYRLGLHCRLIQGHSTAPWNAEGAKSPGDCNLWQRYLATRNVILNNALETAKDVIAKYRASSNISLCEPTRKKAEWILVQPQNTNLKSLNEAGVESVLRLLFKGPTSLVHKQHAHGDDYLDIVKLAIDGAASQVIISREMRHTLQTIKSDVLTMVDDVSKASHPYSRSFLATRLKMMSEIITSDQAKLKSSKTMRKKTVASDAGRRRASIPLTHSIGEKTNTTQWKKQLLKREKQVYSVRVQEMLNELVHSIGSLPAGLLWDTIACCLLVVHLSKNFSVASTVIYLPESQQSIENLQQAYSCDTELVKDDLLRSLTTLIGDGAALRSNSLSSLKRQLSSLWLLYDLSSPSQLPNRDGQVRARGSLCLPPHPGAASIGKPPKEIVEWIGGRYGIGVMCCDLENMIITHQWADHVYRFAFNHPTKYSFWMAYCRAGIHRFFCVEQSLYYLIEEANNYEKNNITKDEGDPAEWKNIEIMKPLKRLYTGPSSAITSLNTDGVTEVEFQSMKDETEDMIEPAALPNGPMELMGYADMEVAHSELPIPANDEQSYIQFENFDRLKKSIAWHVSYWKRLFEATRELCHETVDSRDTELNLMRGKAKRLLLGLTEDTELINDNALNNSQREGGHHCEREVQEQGIKKEDISATASAGSIYKSIIDAIDDKFPADVTDAYDEQDEELASHESAGIRQQDLLVVEGDLYNGLEYQYMKGEANNEIEDARIGGRRTTRKKAVYLPSLNLGDPVPTRGRGRPSNKVASGEHSSARREAKIFTYPHSDAVMRSGTEPITDWPPSHLPNSDKFALIREATIIWRKRLPLLPEPSSCQISLFYKEAQVHDDLFRVRVVAKYNDTESARTFVVKKWQHPRWFQSFEWTLKHLENGCVLPRITQADMLCAEANSLGKVVSSYESICTVIREAMESPLPNQFSKRIPKDSTTRVQPVRRSDTMEESDLSYITAGSASVSISEIRPRRKKPKEHGSDSPVKRRELPPGRQLNRKAHKKVVASKEGVSEKSLYGCDDPTSALSSARFKERSQNDGMVMHRNIRTALTGVHNMEREFLIKFLQRPEYAKLTKHLNVVMMNNDLAAPSWYVNLNGAHRKGPKTPHIQLVLNKKINEKISSIHEMRAAARGHRYQDGEGLLDHLDPPYASDLESPLYLQKRCYALDHCNPMGQRDHPNLPCICRWNFRTHYRPMAFNINLDTMASRPTEVVFAPTPELELEMKSILKYVENIVVASEQLLEQLPELELNYLSNRTRTRTPISGSLAPVLASDEISSKGNHVCHWCQEVGFHRRDECRAHQRICIYNPKVMDHDPGPKEVCCYCSKLIPNSIHHSHTLVCNRNQARKRLFSSGQSTR